MYIVLSSLTMGEMSIANIYVNVFRIKSQINTMFSDREKQYEVVLYKICRTSKQAVRVPRHRHKTCEPLFLPLILPKSTSNSNHHIIAPQKRSPSPPTKYPQQCHTLVPSTPFSHPQLPVTPPSAATSLPPPKTTLTSLIPKTRTSPASYAPTTPKKAAPSPHG